MIGLLVAAAIAVSRPVYPVQHGIAPAQPGVESVEPSPYFLDSSAILQVICPAKMEDGSDGSYLGTAFYVGNGQWVTARHVVRDEDSQNKPLYVGCTIAGVPLKVLDIGKGFVDYAMFSAPLSPPTRMILSCEGMQQGRSYFATGYADGNPWQVTVRLTGSGSKTFMPGAGNNEEVLRGSTVPGQSGGPVVDDRGVVVGIVSAGEENGIPSSIALSLADTPLCKVARK
jgi:hypothetical protein